MTVERGDIIQIRPDAHWGGCLLLVEEVKSWGIQGYVEIPMKGRAYLRVPHEDYEIVGRASWVPADLEVTDGI
jgi:hypothetical protein